MTFSVGHQNSVPDHQTTSWLAAAGRWRDAIDAWLDAGFGLREQAVDPVQPIDLAAVQSLVAG